MKIADDLIDLRILLQNICEGFSPTLSSKNLILSHEIRILHCLSKKDCSSYELITTLGIAKSNLTNITKKMIEQRQIVSFKWANNSKNVYYRIDDAGKHKLDDFRSRLYQQYRASTVCADDQLISNKLTELIHILKGNKSC